MPVICGIYAHQRRETEFIMLKRSDFKAGGELLANLLNGAMEKRLPALPTFADMSGYARAFADGDLVNTCMCLFENDLNVSRTAGKLYMHRNTLIYRIAKLKKLTGLDVRTFDDAVTFIILYRCYLKEAVSR